MIESRTTILDAVRRHRPPATELPPLEGAWTTYADPRQQFITVLESVGGTALMLPAGADLTAHLQQLPHFAAAERVASTVPGVAARGIELATIRSPHELNDLDVAVLPGEFAVAENAAVWVTDRDLPARVLYFLCQHLVLTVPAGEVLPHMHAAYERLAASTFAKPMFGVFISGPSKTADIEQSLVIGAHGPRSLTVCLLEA